MDALEIAYLLKRAGLSQAQIARELGVTNSVVGNVIHNRITAYEVASHIALQLKLDVQTLWPDRYTFKPRRQRRTAAATPALDGEGEKGGGAMT